jgi:excisionase family DNA binding protein
MQKTVPIAKMLALLLAMSAPAPNRQTRRHPPKANHRAYVGIPEAATYLDVTPKTIRRYIAEGRLPAYRLGDRVVRIKVVDLDAALTPMGGE